MLRYMACTSTTARSGNDDPQLTVGNRSPSGRGWPLDIEWCIARVAGCRCSSDAKSPRRGDRRSCRDAPDLEPLPALERSPLKPEVDSLHSGTSDGACRDSLVEPERVTSRLIGGVHSHQQNDRWDSDTRSFDIRGRLSAVSSPR